MPLLLNGDVPCNGCVRCCLSDAIRLLPADLEGPYQYQVVPHPAFPGQMMIDHNPDGTCVYLGENGCEIHDMRPQMCRDMDCRNIAANFTYTEARKINIRIEVWKKGKELLRNAKFDG